MKKILCLLVITSVLFSVTLSVAQTEWPLENTDFINKTNTHTVLGVPEIMDATIGNGVMFNGITDGLLVDDNPVANAEAYTIEFYAYPQETETKAKLINIWTAGEDTGTFVECWGTTPDKQPLSGHVHFKIHQTDGFYWWGKGFSRAVPVDNWYHVAYVVTADQAELWVNHQLDTTTVYAEDPGYVEGREYNPFKGGFTALGVRGGSNQKDFYTGILDHVKFTKEALTPDDFMPVPEAAVSYKVYDMENSGSIEGASGGVTVLGVPEVVDGLMGDALSLNGITDGLLVDENPVANAEAFTLELYAYPKETETKAKFINTWTAQEDTGLFLECWGTTPDKQPLSGHVHFKTHLTDGFYWHGKAFSRAVEVDHWYHVAMVVDDYETKIYVDHELDTSAVYTEDPGYVEGREYHPFKGGFTAIGVRGGSNQKDFYTGLVDHVKFTKAALDPEEFMPVPDQLTSVKISNPENAMPKTMALHQNYPNPFNPTTTIRYDLNETSDVSLKIYNMLGREVRELVVKNQPAGSYQAIWDAKDWNGRSVSAGVYFYVLKANNFQATKKMILIK